MAMTRKSVLYALAVVLLTGSMAVAALADYGWSAEAYRGEGATPDSSVSAQPKQGMEQPDAVGTVEMREPIEAGAVPDRSLSSSGLNSNASGDEPTVEIGGQTYRPDIDFGP